MEVKKDIPELLKLLTSPIGVLTTAWKGKTNAQAVNSLGRTSRLPSVPRLTVIIVKMNLTHELVWNSRSFAVHLLRTDQMPLVRKFGFFTGRQTDKLRDVKFRKGRTGSPILEDCYAFMECRVVNAMDNGASTIFLADVIAGGRKTVGNLLTSEYFRSNMHADWIPEYEALEARSLEFVEKHIRKIDYTPYRA